MVRLPGRIAVVAAVVVAVTACGPRGGQRQGSPPLAVDVAQAQRRDIATYLSLDGQIAPLQQAVLSTQQSGSVVAVYVNEGQRVTRGQLLAKLDDSLLRAQLAQQQAIVVQSRAHLASSTLQGAVTAPAAQSTITTAEQQLQAAKNSVEADQAALDNAQLTFTSNEQLLKQGYVSETQYQQARSAYVAAQQALNSAKEQQRQAEVALRAARSQGTNAVPIQNQQIASDRATLQQALASVKLLQTQIEQTSLIAPFDGVVTQRLLDPGAYASPNAPIVQLAQIDSVYVNVNVPDTGLQYVQKGTPVSFTTSSVPGRTFTGTVFDVNAIPTTGTLSYRARIKMPNPQGVLRGGMLVSVAVRTQYHPNAIVVPKTAVVQNESGAGVFIVVSLPPPPAGAGGAPAAGGPPAAGPGRPPGPPVRIAQAKLVPVKLGLQTDVDAEIQSPDVGPGTTVITSRPDALQDKGMVAIAGVPPGGGSARSSSNTSGAQ
jgi:HlyD family secretion protein